VSFKLTEELREKLKEPLGELHAYPDWNGKFVSVGDECSFLAAKDSVRPLLIVYDNRIRRHDISNEKKEAIEKMPGKKIMVDNPAGTITDEAELAIKLGFEHAPAKIEVKGEEDLLVLPCIMHAEEGTAIYYGQPERGIVKIIVNPESRKKAKEILLSMKEVKQ